MHCASENCSTCFKSIPFRVEDAFQELQYIIRDLIAAGSNLHSFARRYSRFTMHSNEETPLFAIFSSFGFASVICYQKRLYQDALQRGIFPESSVTAITDVLVPVNKWLQLLYESAIDLELYGRKEKQLIRQHRTNNLWQTGVWRRGITKWHEIEKYFSINFVYGSKPSDWQFWFMEQMDDSFANSGI
jgi:hypothetical protein